MQRSNEPSRSVLVWDAWTRLFHWLLAAAVIFLIFSGRTGEFFFDWHRYAGEFVLALVLFRLAWGVVGSSNIRLTQLFTNPLNAVRHLLDLARRRAHVARGHNAAGAWAVVIMLVLVAVQATTGLFIADEDELLEGALYGNFNSSTTALLFRIHHINSELLTVVVCVHVVMILLYKVLARQNLLWPMITGRMRWPTYTSLPEVVFQKFWVGVTCAVLIAAVVGWVCRWYVL